MRERLGSQNEVMLGHEAGEAVENSVSWRVLRIGGAAGNEKAKQV